MTATLTIAKVEDYEGEGECSNCPKTGLRWIATLSDGSKVGLECAKKLMGWRPAPTSYVWVEHFMPVAEHVETAPNGEATTWVMWQRKNGRETRETRNGQLVSVGGIRRDWAERGWI